ncbi:MAG: hypothetical protein ITG00_10745 [Flavobacterium sp.]|nr:hypothetical protein [Flavobacterium sp.]
MLQKIKLAAASALNNRSGWKTSRKIVVIESDDWGNIRMPSVEVYAELLRSGIKADKCGYCQNDSLASETDLQALFSVLIKHQNKHGAHPVITANTIVANPDFDKIRAHGFEAYFYEPFTETLARYPEHQGAFALWQQGMEQRLFHPQLHGREHLNVALWMEQLRNGAPETRLAFDHRVFGLSSNITNERRASYLSALNFRNPGELESQKEILADAQNLFEKIFGYRSKSFIAPNYVWSEKHENTLAEAGVSYLQSAKYQMLAEGDGIQQKLRHYTGDKNGHDQYYLVRNCLFEPSLTRSALDVDNCLLQMSTAFAMGRPAIISSHRLNYIGFINKRNSEANLKKLDNLLASIIHRWPDVEFITSDQLGDIIKNEKP